jgi:predicted nucleic acid-binding protein
VILDTNAISAMAEGDTALEKALPDVRSQFIPVICLGEYRAGIIRSRARRELERWLKLLEGSRKVLAVELETSRFYAACPGSLDPSGCLDGVSFLDPDCALGGSPEARMEINRLSRSNQNGAPSETAMIVNSQPTKW